PIFSTFGLMVSELRHEDTGPPGLATAALGAHNYSPLILSEFRAEFPRVSVSVRVPSEAEAITLAEGGLADFVIAAAPKHTSCLKVAARTRIAFQLVAPGGHCWPSARRTWPQVLDLPLFVRERVSGIQVSLEELLTRDRLIGRLRISAELTTPELAIELVRAGFGVALVPYAPRLAAYFAGLSVVNVPAGLEEKSIAVMHREDLYLPRYRKRSQELASAAIRQLSVSAS
ncbi:MAG: LysR family transcriptional regulator substrate-binding protein, partial [Acidobacteriota bacterium]